MPGKAEHTSYQSITPSTTKDGSAIRELMHPEQGAVRNQSLAEAIVAVGQSTLPHCHHASEEIYHVLAGQGQMQLAERFFMVRPGDTIAIAPGTRHAIRNTGDVPLRILCCCAPPYRHEDTSLTGEITSPQTKE